MATYQKQIAKMIVLDQDHSARMHFVRTWSAPTKLSIYIGRGSYYDQSNGSDYAKWYSQNYSKIAEYMKDLARQILEGADMAFVLIEGFEKAEAKVELLTDALQNGMEDYIRLTTRMTKAPPAMLPQWKNPSAAPVVDEKPKTSRKKKATSKK